MYDGWLILTGNNTRSVLKSNLNLRDIPCDLKILWVLILI